MKEAFLHFIWETKSYFSGGWETLDGRPVTVLDPGLHNLDQGPDFLDARVIIEEIEQVGHVEIHLDSKDWFRHQHHTDPQYDPVILHVVLVPKGGVLRADGTQIPEVSLNGRIHAGLMSKADYLQLATRTPACRNMLRSLPLKVKKSWFRHLAAERLEGKLALLKDRMSRAQLDWEQLIWEELAAFIAGPVNQEAFRTMARMTPLKILRRYQSVPLQREALLLGSLGLLEGQPRDEYQQELQTEWAYLSALHRLRKVPVLLKNARMRPGNFPLTRAIQLGLIVQHFHRLTSMLYPESLQEFTHQEIAFPSYWQIHHAFGRLRKSRKSYLGKETLKILLLNCLVPLGIMYAQSHGIREWEGQIRLLPRSLRPENNRLIRVYRNCGVSPENAEQGQAMIQMYTQWCRPKRCLHCQIGRFLLQEPNWAQVRKTPRAV